MPDGGTLTIEAARLSVDSRFAFGNPPLEPGPYVRLTVRDTGRGMTDEVKHRIFDPFFTTKEVGQGTGLGRSTVYGITKQLRGFLLVESGVGQGTRFDLYFPEAKGLLSHRAERATLEVAATSAGVLVVEDDPGVRALTVNVLRRHGYRVVEASGATDVARLAAAVMEGIELLLTDIGCRRCRDQRSRSVSSRITPSARPLHVRIFRSAKQRDATAGAAFLRKPFTAGELLRAVKTALASKDSVMSDPGPLTRAALIHEVTKTRRHYLSYRLGVFVAFVRCRRRASSFGVPWAGVAELAQASTSASIRSGCCGSRSMSNRSPFDVRP